MSCVDRPLSTPAEVLEVEVECSSRAGGVVVDCGGGGDDGGGDGDGDLAALLSVLESRYTLIYRSITTARHTRIAPSLSVGSSSDGSGSDLGGTVDNNICRATTNASGGGNSGGSGGGGGSDGDERSPPAEILPERLELWLVEDSSRRKGCSQKEYQGGCGDEGEDRDGDGNGGPMTKWLLEHAIAILVDALPGAAPTGRD